VSADTTILLSAEARDMMASSAAAAMP
jgi:hypothetical protein